MRLGLRRPMGAGGASTPWRRAAAAGLLIAALAGLSAPAEAHPEFVASDPAPDARLLSPPERVTVTLSEPIESGASLHVRDHGGRAVDLGDVAASSGPRSVLSVGLPSTLPHGGYHVEWVVSGADGHVVRDGFAFAVGAGVEPPADTSGGVPVGPIVARAVAYVGFALAFASLAFTAWMAPLGYPRSWARFALLAGATLHLSGTVLEAAQAWQSAGVDAARLARELDPSDLGVHGIRLLRLLLAGGAFALAFVWTLRPVAGGSAVVGGLLLGSAATFARLGHPYLAGPSIVALDLVHLLAASVWVGGLALLAHLALRPRAAGLDDDGLRRLGTRFGTLALVAVFALVLSGLVVAVAVVGADVATRPDLMLAAPYGLVLLAKVGLAAVMVGLATANRYVLLEPATDVGLAGRLQGVARTVTRGRLAPGQARTFGRTVAIEAGTGALVLVLAGILTSVPPPAGADAAVLAVEGTGDLYLVHVEAEAPRAGEAATLHLRIAPKQDPGHAFAPPDCAQDGAAGCVFVLVLYGSGSVDGRDAVFMDGAWMVHDAVWQESGEATLAVTVDGQAGRETVEATVAVAP
jgi:copper transport protein